MLSFWGRLRFLKSYLRLARDPRRTNEVFNLIQVGIDSGDENLFRPIVDHVMKDSGFRALFEKKYLPPIPKLAELRKFPSGTLGCEYARHLESNNLTIDFFPSLKMESPIHYIAQRARQTHDIWHLITQFDTSPEGEFALQAFTLAQIGTSASAALLSAGILHVIAYRPRELLAAIDLMVRGYEMGKESPNFLGIPWEDHWATPLAELKLIARTQLEDGKQKESRRIQINNQCGGEPYKVHKGHYVVSTDPQKLNGDMIHSVLTRSYWAEGVSREAVLRRIKSSHCFGLYDGDQQIGFARVISDFESFAYLCDVFIVESYRNQGLATWLMECILKDPSLQKLRRWFLATKDAQDLYAKFGFEPLPDPNRFMQLQNDHVYPETKSELATQDLPEAGSQARDKEIRSISRI